MHTASGLQRLSSLLELSSLLSCQHELGTLLQTVVDTARELCHADLGGLLVLSDSDPSQYSQLFVSGWSTPPRHYPTGQGVFNLPVVTGQPLRVENVPDHPASVGTPAGHPPIGPFLGVPLKCKDRIEGTLFVANFPGNKPFTEDDEELLLAFATHAAAAIQNARLWRQVEELAILRERERLAADLHDTLAQIFFSIGMELEHLQHVIPESERPRLCYLMSLVSRGTARVRGAISQLYEKGGLPGDANLYRRLAVLVEEFRTQYKLQVGLVITGDVHRVPAAHQEVICRVVRESLMNVYKHAQAEAAVVTLVVGDGHVRLTVQDNGRGIQEGAWDATPDVHRFGLVAMRRQVERIGGRLEVGNGDEGGCTVRVWLPIQAPGRGDGDEADSGAGCG